MTPTWHQLGRAVPLSALKNLHTQWYQQSFCSSRCSSVLTYMILSYHPRLLSIANQPSSQLRLWSQLINFPGSTVWQEAIKPHCSPSNTQGGLFTPFPEVCDSIDLWAFDFKQVLGIIQSAFIYYWNHMVDETHSWIPAIQHTVSSLSCAGNVGINRTRSVTELIIFLQRLH